MEWGLIIAGIIIAILFFANVRIVPQATEYVIEILGKYKTTWGAGLHVKIPIIEKIAKNSFLKTKTKYLYNLNYMDLLPTPPRW